MRYFFFFIFRTLLLSHFLFVCLFLVILFYFVSNSNKHFSVCTSKKILLLVVDVFWCSSSGDALAFAHFSSSSHGCISCHIGDNMSFKFRGVETKHNVSFCLFLLLFVYNFCFVDFYFWEKFLHSVLEHTTVRLIADTGLRSSSPTLARAQRPISHTLCTPLLKCDRAHSFRGLM